MQYNIPKKSADASGLTLDTASMGADNSLNRRKKTPEELQAEAELADADDFTSKRLMTMIHLQISRNLLKKKYDHLFLSSCRVQEPNREPFSGNQKPNRGSVFCTVIK
jgi:hypothetical protein